MNDTMLVALRDISVDEELHFDYSTTMSEGDWTMRCRCGAAQCRSLIGASTCSRKHLNRDIWPEASCSGSSLKSIMHKSRRQTLSRYIPPCPCGRSRAAGIQTLREMNDGMRSTRPRWRITSRRRGQITATTTSVSRRGPLARTMREHCHTTKKAAQLAWAAIPWIFSPLAQAEITVFQEGGFEVQAGLQAAFGSSPPKIPISGSPISTFAAVQIPGTPSGKRPTSSLCSRRL